MSRQLINQYYSKLDRIIQYGGSRNETAIRQAFYPLLNDYANKKNLELITEIRIRGTKGNEVQPDGVLKNALRLDFGYWESKDESDGIEEEIDKKLKKGYPLTNALFEDSATAVLYQNGEKLLQVDMKDPDALDRILNAFVNFEKPEIRDFVEAIEKFKEDLPTIIETLRKKIDEEGEKNKKFMEARQKFWEHCQAEINPEITLADIREMIIQHIATSDIFVNIFNDPDFHRQNNIAQQIEHLVEIIFTRSIRKNMLDSLQSYYGTIKEASASIADHHEKQKFLKVLYENFYKAYNPKGADRLGVVYTPNEIVHFMIESTEYLLERHFGKTLADKNVEILDPATGTGTFICDLIEYIPKQHLPYKFKEEIHANEIAILPYYIANLNIEYTYKQKMGYYDEYKNICFVDTLDNTDALAHTGKQHGLFAFSTENAERIKRQNTKKISVIIGNPPYNANQQNENENNKNREYKDVDKRIKETYIKYSTAQKTKVYDMYARFYRWAMDRIDRNGVIAMITNRSFIDSRTFDGFRRCVQDDFSHAIIIDTKSDVRANQKIAGTTHNVFGIQTGVAIMFLVKKEKPEGKCRIEYVALDDFWRKEEKLAWLKEHKLKDIEFEKITPDKSNNWLNLADNDFENLLCLFEKDVKLGRSKEAVFELFTLGTVSNRDEWVYDFDIKTLKSKIKYFIDAYNSDLSNLPKTLKDDEIEKFLSKKIKYTRDLKKDIIKRRSLEVDKDEFRLCNYRAFTKLNIYYASELNEMRYQTPLIFPKANTENILIGLNQGSKPFNTLASKFLVDLHFNGDTQCIPLYRYDDKGNRQDNITDWGLEQFQTQYDNKKITKEDIFYYTYAVLHNPAYRKKYELNLKREFPRLPFYEDFKQWIDWGKELMDLHINYEQAKPYALKEITSATKAEHKKAKELFSKSEEPEALYARKEKIKVKLKADKEKGIIEIDELTLLTGVPSEAWEYKLGNRSALEWVLDQYKEKKPSDPTIAEKFDTYRFAGYKEHVIELLKKVCTVSVNTMKTIAEMKSLDK
ncbi:MAG: N-6 DNA methylase [Bacteroidetes bacterium]|nr:N-6 DNA methylase [Bacteroidota bacterium]MBI3481490.1 N-6 DNA methylase [Bacteroidota bacterium]